jgi:hypothetical protein
MTRRNLMAAGIFGAVAIGVAALAGAANYFDLLSDDDDDGVNDKNEGTERNATTEPKNAPAQPPSGAPQ